MNKVFLFSTLLLFTVSCTTVQQTTEQPVPASYQSALTWPAWYDYSATDTVTILSYNLEHFVDDYDNPYIDHPRENNPEGMEERRQLLAELLRNVDADILVFQEFESKSYMMALLEEYVPELGYMVYGGSESPDWYMNVVVASRIPLGIFYSYSTANTPIVGLSDADGTPSSQTFTNNRMWSVDVMVSPDYEFTLTGVHLKAGRGERNENWRHGQMELLRRHYEQMLFLNPERNILAVGDFNATPDSWELARFLGEGTGVEFIDPLAGTEIYSHSTSNPRWRIDHILPNIFMLPEIVEGSIQMASPLTDEEMIKLSDHYPMVVKIIPTDR